MYFYRLFCVFVFALLYIVVTKIVNRVIDSYKIWILIALSNIIQTRC